MSWRILWTAVLLLAAAFDLQRRYIPNWLTYGGIALGLVAAALAGQEPLLAALAGGGVSLLVWGLAFGLGMLWPGGRHMDGALGLGDVKLGTFVGVVCGWPAAVTALLIAMLAGGLAGLASIVWRLVRGRYQPGVSMAYGPYLVIGGLAGLWTQEWLVALWQLVTQ